MTPARSAFLAAIVCFASGRTAQAAPPWVDRPDTLPAGNWSFDFGLGIGHVPPPPAGESDTGVGVNFDMAVGITDRIELGLRTGLRVGDGWARGIHADEYGRLFDREYVDGADGWGANPELRILGALVRADLVELGLEGRVFVPVESNDAAIEFGMPVAFHIGRRVRLDTGVWIPVFIPPPGYNASVGLSAPLDVWIQVSPRVWLGPMTGLVWGSVNSPPNPVIPSGPAAVTLGFGFGYEITRAVDFKAQFLDRDLFNDYRFFGLGAGVQIRIE
jgi:hypothetical protein